MAHRRVRRIGIVTTAVTAAMLAPPTAHAAVGAGRTAIVTPIEGIVIVDGLVDDAEHTIEVRRGEVLVSSVTATPEDWGVPGALEVNHLADPTLCWQGASPEILPGDQVRIIGNDALGDPFVDTIDVIDLRITEEITQTDADSATVKGVVSPRPAGPASAFLNVFLRADAGGDFREFANEAPNTITYDTADPADGSFTATFNGLSQAQINAAQNPKVLEAEYARAANEIITAPPGDGPGAPEDPSCPPLASRAVTTVAPAVLNIANAGGGVTIQGVTSDASQVDVSVGGVEKSVAPTPAGGAGQTWSVSYTGAELAGLTGTIPVTATHVTAGGTISGRDATLVRDVTAPATPGVSPDGGTHDNSVQVSLSAPAGETGASLHYTTDGSAPTASSTRYTGAFTLNASATVRAITVDAAGNPSTVRQAAFTVAKAPGEPTNLTPGSGDGTASLSWTEGPINNAAITGYQVRAVTGGQAPVVANLPAGTTSHTFTGLTNGAPYTLSVRATNSAGDGPFATAASTVTPLGPPQAPANVGATPGNGSATVSWAPGGNGGTAITGYTVRAFQDGVLVSETDFGAAQTQGTVSGLANGAHHTFRVVAHNAVGASPESAASATVRPEERPLRPGILAPLAGRPGGATTATARWLAPAPNTATITGYVVQAWKIRPGRPAVLRGESVTGRGARSRTMLLPKGTYKFRVRAVGAVADSRWSARSPKVRAR